MAKNINIKINVLVVYIPCKTHLASLDIIMATSRVSIAGLRTQWNIFTLVNLMEVLSSLLNNYVFLRQGKAVRIVQYLYNPALLVLQYG